MQYLPQYCHVHLRIKQQSQQINNETIISRADSPTHNLDSGTDDALF